jgi:hypothetical protein
VHSLEFANIMCNTSWNITLLNDTIFERGVILLDQSLFLRGCNDGIYLAMVVGQIAIISASFSEYAASPETHPGSFTTSLGLSVPLTGEVNSISN